MSFVFNPVTGLNDTTQFPDEDILIRQHLQALIQQIPTYCDTNLANKTQEEWIVATLYNGWVHDTPSLSYFKDTMGIVHIDGAIKNGASAASTILARVPVGYRPRSIARFTILKSNDASLLSIAISNTGDITMSSLSATTGLYFFNFSYKADN